MEHTNNLDLPYILPAQAQKHVTHNEALRSLDTLVQTVVRSRNITQPPPDALEGDAFIVAPGASGIFEGEDHAIAAWHDGSWHFHMPQEGWTCFVREDGDQFVFRGGAWELLHDVEGELESLEQLGINATGDTTNRLNLSSPASLFSHEGSGHQLKINKAQEGDTGSVLFQTGFSGRAEMGLAGTDDFSFKVSSDGDTWKEALSIDAETGAVSLPHSPQPEPPVFNLLGDGGRFGGTPDIRGILLPNFVAPAYLSPYNGATFNAGEKFGYNSETFGGTGAALSQNVEDLMLLKHGSAAQARLQTEFYLLEIVAGSGTVVAKTTDGVARYRLVTTRTSPLHERSTVGSFIRVHSGSLSIVPDVASREIYLDGVRQDGDVVIDAARGWVQVAQLGVDNTAQTYGFSINLFGLYAEPGGQGGLALPFIVPTRLPMRPGRPWGPVPSITAWN